MKIELCRLVDGVVSCQLEEEEFYILPKKAECTIEDIVKALNALTIKYDEQKEKDIQEAIEQELGERKAEAVEW